MASPALHRPLHSVPSRGVSPRTAPARGGSVVRKRSIFSLQSTRPDWYPHRHCSAVVAGGLVSSGGGQGLGQSNREHHPAASRHKVKEAQRCRTTIRWSIKCSRVPPCSCYAPRAGSAQAQPGWVLSHQKISDTQGGFTGTLDDDDRFGISVGSLGDLDRDGAGDLAVGALLDDDGGRQRGAVWVLFLDGAPCPADLTGDGSVGITDLLIVLALWGPCLPDCFGDFDGDGTVGILDLLTLLANWGACP